MNFIEVQKLKSYLMCHFHRNKTQRTNFHSKHSLKKIAPNIFLIQNNFIKKKKQEDQNALYMHGSNTPLIYL